MTVSDLQEYRDRTKDSEKLGAIVMISGRQTIIPLSKIKTDLEDAGLGDLVPKPTALSDLWRKATSAAARKGVEIGGKRLNVLIRKLKDDEKEIIRSVVVETCDAAGKVLSYEEVAHVIFYKESGRMRVKRLVDVGGVADDVIQDLRDRFAARTIGEHVRVGNKTVPGYTKDQDDIRTLITDAVKALKAIPVRDTGGVYFVPKSHTDQLAKLENVARMWQGAECHSLPLIEDDATNPNKQHELVAGGLTASVLLEVDQVLADLRDTRNKNGGKVTDRKAGTFVKASKELRERVAAYQDLLQDSLEDAVERLQILELAVKQVALGAAA